MATGAKNGIGFETALALASRDAATAQATAKHMGAELEASAQPTAVCKS
jgi:hypothetical protein